MMDNNKLIKGMAAGALLGGAIMMLDKETRQYVIGKSKTAACSCRNAAQHPSEAIHTLRTNYESFSERLNNGIDQAIELLNKIEAALNKIGEVDEAVNNQLGSADNSKEAS
ncbi:YtxH domain-containing protein [Halobacillus sp. Marseille-Q1614]|uniref:YtxH domain-containing protein n=1 Tax=Halobacillus sp. Marseille-Q1614 TaxID=2709134 RepID=UPI001570E1F9|nr:YtxH domain-containing protein [Halobacillus sp. Marseille-Q1614]